MKHPRIIALGALAAALVFALAGCAPASKPVHSPSSSSAAAPTPTPTPAYLSQPASRYSVGCDGLFPPNVLSSIFASPLSAVDAPAVTHGAPEVEDFDSNQNFSGFSIRSLGGLDCAWTNGGPNSASFSQSVVVTVLPETAAQYAAYSASTTANDQVDCNGIGHGSLANFCLYNNYTNGSLLVVEISGMKINPGYLPKSLPAPVQTLVNSVLATTAKLKPAFAQPTGSVPLPATPDLVPSASQLQSALGTTVSVSSLCNTSGDGGRDLAEEAQFQITGTTGCSFIHSAGTDNANYGSVEWLPGGQWAATEAEAKSPGEMPLQVQLPDGDTASIVAGKYGATYMDLVIGGNWLYVSLEPAASVGGESTDASTASSQAALIALAKAFEENIRG